MKKNENLATKFISITKELFPELKVDFNEVVVNQTFKNENPSLGKVILSSEPAIFRNNEELLIQLKTFILTVAILQDEKAYNQLMSIDI